MSNETIETLNLALEEIAVNKDCPHHIRAMAKTALTETSQYSHIKPRQPVMVTNSHQTDCPNVYKVSYFSGVVGACVVDIERNAYQHCLTLQEFADKFKTD